MRNAARAGFSAFPTPTVSVYHGDDRRHAWVEIRAQPLDIID